MLNLLRASKKKGLITISISLLAIVVTAFVLLLPKEKEEKTISQINLKQQNNYNAVATINGTSWYYDLDENGNAINVHYKEGELGENVIIPETLDGHIVVKIYNSENGSKSIFGDKSSSIKAVVIPEGVTSIGEYTFYGCSSLTSINVPEGVTSIGESAFYGCSNLTSINIPEGVTRIGNGAFEDCSKLTSINILEGVTSIGAYTFRGCSSLTCINIPEKVTSIGDNAFNRCSSLTSINIPEGVTSIGVYAFYNCSSLTSINIPEGVTSIGRNAFYNCSSLTSINIPEGVTSIGVYAFYNCSSLTSINIPEGVTSIGSHAFGYCSNLTSINIPGVTSIEEYTFRGCSSLTNIVIPSGVTSIGDWAFYCCSTLTSINISEGVRSIGEYAFDRCSSLTSINIPEGVTSIGRQTFASCSSLTSIEIPSSVTSIGESAFYECKSLTSINIPERVTSIGSVAFASCSSLTSIVIPSSVTSIEYMAFDGCSSLTSIVIPSSVTSIGNMAFYGCKSLTSINIPEGVTSIGRQTFDGCSSLTSIEIPSSVTGIGNYAFYGCKNLTSIEIPSSVTGIGNYAFYRCKVTLAVANNELDIQKIELPEIIKRSQVEGDILYSDQKLTLNNCEISEDGNKLKVYTGNKATLKVNSGVLEELEIEIVPSGTITYSNTYWTRNNIVAILHIAEGERIKEKDKGNIHTFTENGEFTFKYVDTNNEEKEVVAKVENIDKQAPIIKSVKGNPTEWTKESVTIKINAEDNLSGLAEQAYSFDGGETWQKENEKTYTENTSNIVIKVRDDVGNVAEYEPISITKIIKLTEIKVTNESTKKRYIEGENFDKTGMVVTASYNDGTSKAVTNYTVTDGNSLTAGKTSVTISYTENGITKTAKQAITVVEKEKLEIEVKTYQEVKENEINYIEKIMPSTSIETLRKNIETNGTIEIYNNKNEKITNENELIATGMEIVIKLEEQEKRYTAVVIGDLSGDGKISIGDLLKLSRYEAKIDTNLTGAYLRASDVRGKGQYGGISNLIKMSRIIAGMDNL